VSQRAGGEGFEYLIVGSGPGGAPVAAALAKAGKRVAIVERGAYHKRLLGFPGGARLADKLFVFCRSREGVIIGRGLTVGGSSVIYNANVFEPSAAFCAALGLDLAPEIAELKAAIGVRELPERFFSHNGSRGTELMCEQAERLGVPFRPQPKFIDPDRCQPGCDQCMLGCRRGAKWTTRHFVEQARRHGATLLCSSAVGRLTFDSAARRVTGVQLVGGRTLAAERVVLAAGGVGSPAILQRSGIVGVGQRFFMDPMVVLFGLSRYPDGGTWREMTFTHAIEACKKDGFIIGNCGAYTAWTAASFARPSSGWPNWFKVFGLRRGMGLFVKLADDDNGTVAADESMSKVWTENDQARMSRGVQLATEIMVKSGAEPASIGLVKWAGGHPGGTVAMGRFVDRGFQTEFDNLYVCDGSVMPVSPGVPPALTIMAMSRLLGKFLLGAASPEQRIVCA